MKRDGVSVAFEMILEEIQAVEAQLNLEGASAFKESRYKDADRLSATGKQLSEFRGKLEALRKECGVERYAPKPAQAADQPGKMIRGQRLVQVLLPARLSGGTRRMALSTRRNLREVTISRRALEDYGPSATCNAALPILGHRSVGLARSPSVAPIARRVRHPHRTTP